MSHDDFEVEPIPGLPALPPNGERILWSGSPHWPSLSRHAFHIDKVVIYFILLIAWRMVSQWHSGAAGTEVLGAALAPLVIATVAVTILVTIAYATAKATIYTITSRRIVMRFGIALPITFNLPFASISNAGLRKFANSTGDLPIEQNEAKRLPYLVLWPHVRPWIFKSPQPMLRCVRDAPRVAQILSGALATYSVRSGPASIARPVASDRPVPETSTRGSPQLVAAE